MWNSALDRLARTYQQARAGLLPDAPLLVVGQPTPVEATRAPTGRHVLWVMVRAVPAVVRGDTVGRLAAGPWVGVKEAYADRMMDQLERHAPGLKARVRARAVFSPSDLEAVNPNLHGGDLLAGSHHLSQWYGRRALLGGKGYGTPIRRLYVTGAATWPGAGSAPTSGTLLAGYLLGATSTLRSSRRSPGGPAAERCSQR